MEVETSTQAPEVEVDVDLNLESEDSGEEQIAKPSGPDPKFLEALRRHKEKVKIDGEEIEVDYETMKRDYQIRKASDKKFHEASMKEKRVEEFLKILKTNPKQILMNKNLGLDMRQLAEEILVEHLQDDMMDPKDRELNKYKKQIAEIEEQKRLAQQKSEQEQQSQLREKYSDDYSNEIVDALKAANLPKSEHTVKRMAYYMHQALKQGYDLKAGDAVGMVRQDYINEQKFLFNEMSEDVLADILGEENVKKIRRYEAKRLKTGNTLPRTPQQPKGVEVHKRNVKNNKISVDQWKEKLKKFD